MRISDWADWRERWELVVRESHKKQFWMYCIQSASGHSSLSTIQRLKRTSTWESIPCAKTRFCRPIIPISPGRKVFDSVDRADLGPGGLLKDVPEESTAFSWSLCVICRGRVHVYGSHYKKWFPSRFSASFFLFNRHSDYHGNRYTPCKNSGIDNPSNSKSANFLPSS